jgi:hypothetical protein
MNIVEFERDMNALIIQTQRQPMQAIKEAIMAEVLSKCNKRSAIHMHLRLKHGANARTHTMSRHELADLVEMISSNENDIAKRLANFYARIAVLRARIEEFTSTMSEIDLVHDVDMNMNPIHPKTSDVNHLLELYAKNEEKRREKQNENQREFAQIMQSSWNPDLTEDDLCALETRVEHIAERGYAAEDLRRLKIMEAVLEERRFNELTSII